MNTLYSAYPLSMNPDLEQNHDRRFAKYGDNSQPVPLIYNDHGSTPMSDRDPLTLYRFSVNLPEPNDEDETKASEPFYRNPFQLGQSTSDTTWTISPWSYPMPTPNSSRPASTYSSSRFSGSQSPPGVSPHMATLPYSPEACPRDFSNCLVSSPRFEGDLIEGTRPCIALRELHIQAESAPELMSMDGDDDYLYDPQPAMANEVQEGYQPLEGAPSLYDSASTPDITPVADSPVSVAQDSELPNLRHRRSTASCIRTGNGSRSTRGARRTGSNSSTSTISPILRTRRTSEPVDSSRPFVCPFAIYECKSSFGSKNEWKRHVNTQHMRMGFWRCDQCDTRERKPNDFNRKDLFTQHVRRMHSITAVMPAKQPKGKGQGSSHKHDNNNCRNSNGKNEYEEQALAAIAARCYRHLRDAPDCTSCLFCDEDFVGDGTWDERMEHIGRHMEAIKRGDEDSIEPSAWRVDEHMQAWLIRERLVVAGEDGLVLAD